MKNQVTFLCVLALMMSLAVTGCSKSDNFSTPDEKVRDLAFDGECLWVAGGQNNKIYQLSKTGKVLNEINSPSDSPRGLTWDGESLWVSTGLIHGTIYQIDTNGNVLMEFKAPSDKPSGLAWVDGYLFYAEVHGVESYTGRIYKVDPADGSVLDSFDSPGNRSEGLGYDGENLLLVSSVGASFYKINPYTGAVLEGKKTPFRSPTGVTWDGKNIWICSPTQDVIKKL